jgi:hypothetical protein
MKTETAPTHAVRIYTSGPLHLIEDTCRAFCLRQGLCVTVDPTRFIYTGGEETGAVVGLLNYPRFPQSPDEINRVAEDLAREILSACHQHSVLIVRPENTHWITRRDD